MRTFALAFATVVSAAALTLSGSVASATPQKVNENTSPSQTVTIQPGDSLSKIATVNGSTIQRLYDANTSVENPDLIYPGEKLRVPAADEELTHRPMPTYEAPVVAPATQQTAPVATPTPVAPVAPRAAPAQPAAPTATSGSVWDRLAQCESGGNWAINTGNGYYGGLQFSLSSWQAVGGSGLPSDASRDEQIMRGQKLQAIQGWGAWPACTAKLGIR